jgi:hypothetical protein
VVRAAPWGRDDGDGGPDDPLDSAQGALDLAAELAQEAEAGGSERAALAVLAAGDWEENLEFGAAHEGVALVGRCRELARVEPGEDESDQPALEVTFGPSVVADLTLGGDGRGVVLYGSPMGSDRELLLDRVRIEDVRGIAAVVAGGGAVLTLQDSEVEGVDGEGGSGIPGRGIDVEQGGRAILRNSSIAGALDVGVFVSGDASSAELEGVTIREVPGEDPDRGGIGLMVIGGADVVGSGLRIEGVTGLGIGMASTPTARSTLDLADSTIAGTLPRSGDGYGIGVELNSGSRFVGRGLIVEGSIYHGVVGFDPGTELELEDSAIVGVRSPPDNSGGRGIVLSEGAQGTLLRTRVEGAEEAGISATRDSLVVLEDCEVVDNPPRPDGHYGRGVTADRGGELEMVGGLVARNHDIGAHVAMFGSRMSLTDVVVEETKPRPDGGFGRGVEASQGAILELTGSRIVASADLGVYLHGEYTLATLNDVEVSNTQGEIRHNRGVGLAVVGAATLLATNLRAAGNLGPALYVATLGTAEVEGFEFEDNGFAGAVLLDGSLSLRDGLVAGSLRAASGGGGCGVFASAVEATPALLVEDVEFQELVSAALYFRGAGSYRVLGGSVSAAGSAAGTPWPPSVLAVEGSTPFDDSAPAGSPAGLLLDGLALDGNGPDGAPAVLLDASSATLRGIAAAPGGGELLWWQHCESLPAPVLEDSAPADASCRELALEVAPLLDYEVQVEESEAAAR